MHKSRAKKYKTAPAFSAGAVLFCLLLAACGHARDDQGYHAIDCSGWFEDWGDCVAAADRMCEKKGGYVARWHEGGDDRILRVRCGGD